MTDFPADILSLATTTVSKISSLMEDAPTLGDAATEAIAEAIAAERERCVKIAETEVENCRRMMDRLTGGAALEALSAASVMAGSIATAIRSGEQP